MPNLRWHSCELHSCRRRIEAFCLIVFLMLITPPDSSASTAMQSAQDQLPEQQSCQSSDEACRDCATCKVTRGRPYLRSSLARSVYSKIMVDEDFQKFDQTKWYAVNADRLAPEDGDAFVQLSPDDEETQLFLARSQERSEAVFTQLFHLAARTFLAPFVSQTSINGLLRRGSMFVLSAKQFRRVFRLPDEWRAERMLDLGAGDGATTALLAPMFDRVHVTEMSWPMKRVLRARGFTLEDVDTWNATYADGYDVICALNLLDRCSRPLTLLEQVKRSLRPGGFALLALVWPFSPYVEFSASGDHRPDEVLPIEGKSFEEQAASLMSNVLRPMGFNVLGWSRAPYLCEGDLERSFYHLNDIIVALSVPQDG